MRPTIIRLTLMVALTIPLSACSRHKAENAEPPAASGGSGINQIPQSLVTKDMEYNQQAVSLQQSRNWIGLDKLCEKWVRESPRSSSAWMNLGLALDMMGHPYGAATAYQNALSLPMQPWVQQYVAGRLQLMYGDLSGTDKARKLYPQLRKVNPALAASLAQYVPQAVAPNPTTSPGHPQP
ncbi:MAG TPA: hypothetical protein VMV27_06970 [Candidatus Binataceae bacterium]|nr:hypothetical protein [Candidatus Binataceae bacterium]HVB82907.1 hypothetical protein [Candidatus Binataceae bacterium]